ncbi:MAG: hypothetical protein C5B50_16515 [Verrucomicrobia bacterium]|nr:MAG: hypothetical protein C5B50_16515 [Verrucomicrobiota bacterium]
MRTRPSATPVWIRRIDTDKSKGCVLTARSDGGHLRVWLGNTKLVGMRIEVSFHKLLFLSLTLAGISSQGATYYVSTAGSDSNPGTSAQPFRTITHAYSLAGAGATILVAPGVYTDYTSGWGIHLGASGTASSPIVLRSQTKGAAIIDRQNLSDGESGFYIDGSYNIVDGFEIRNSPRTGIDVYGNNNGILNCHIHDNGTPSSPITDGGSGIYSSEGTSGNIYMCNTIDHNGRSTLDHGLYLCGQNEQLINNSIFSNAGNGLQVAGYTTVSNMKVYNNVLALNGANGIILWQALSGVDIKNNIFLNNAHYGIGSYAATGSGVVVNNNDFFGNGYGNYNFSDGGSTYSYSLGAAAYTDPLLANETAAGLDPHLLAGSPAIQSGLNLYSTFTTDIQGNARPTSGAWDLGPCAYGVTVSQSGTLYVSTTGSDSNPGTAAQPFRTITHAYSLAAPGATILVAPGVYTDYTSGWGIHLGASGTASSPIVLRSQTKGAAIIDRQNLSDGESGFYIDGSYNVVDGFEIRNSPKTGIDVYGNGNQILNCHIHDNGTPSSPITDGGSGIYSSQGTSGNIYMCNTIDHNGRSTLDHGLYLCGQNEQMINNSVFSNAGNGLQVAGYTTVSGMKVYNNVLALNGANGIILWQALSGVDIKNNIFLNNAHYGIGSYAATGSGVVVNNNDFFGNGYGNYNFSDGGSTYSYNLGVATYSDPLLANETATGLDPHLLAGSPAIQLGLNLYSSCTNDMQGNPRPATGAWDLGPCVYAGSLLPSLPTVSVVATVSTTGIGSTNYGVITFTRTGSTASSLTVNYTLGGTAVKWNDYYRVPQGDMPTAITIPAGAASYAMNICARTNSTRANPETATFTLSADPSYNLGTTTTATLTIKSSTTSTPPPTLHIHKTLTGIILSWDSIIGTIYRVAYKSTLGASTWTDISGDITATDTSSSWTDTTTSGVNQRFYTVYAIN